MMNDVLLFAAAGAVGYVWSCAVAPPIVRAAWSCVARRTRGAVVALGLACAGAVVWTIVPLTLGLMALLLDPAIGVALLRATAWGPGLAIGGGVWLLRSTIEREMPRVGETFEAATAVAIVAAADDDPATVARVSAIYRAWAIDGSSSVNTAPPSGAFEARTSPPWRDTMARTIESPSPLPEGTRVPAREASTL
jgi:hypothetical protein